MRALIRHIVQVTYKPLLERYLSRTRVYTHSGTRLLIPADVFHPGFFFSSRLLLNYVSRLSLTGKRFLELGAGSGLIAMKAAQKSAFVTASDINPVAIEFLELNSRKNQAEIRIIQSDLFRAIPPDAFDVIVINPPYYMRNPRTYRDYAWCCGEHGEYFERLFREMKHYVHDGSEIYMVLFERADLELIENLAIQNGFGFTCVHTSQNMLEKNFIFKIYKERDV